MIARPPVALPVVALPVVALIAFVTLLILLVVGWAPLHEADTAVSEALRAYGGEHPGLVALARVVTDVATTVPYVVAGGAVTLALLARDRRSAGVLTGLVTALVPALWGLAHGLLHRPRPEDGFVVVTSNGFPSGHTANATAAGLVAVLVLWPGLARARRAAVVALAAVFAILIGLTRVLLLAHWPADVLGGWLLALVVVPLAARVAYRFAPGGRTTGAPPAGPGVGDSARRTGSPPGR